VEFRDYFRALRQHWLLIVSVLLLAMSAAAFLSLRTTPLYQTSITFFITSPSGSDTNAAYQGGLFSQQRVTSYADLLTGDQVAGAVVKDLGLDTSPAALAGQIETSIVPNTVLLKASVKDPSPRRAQQIASSLGVQFSALVKRLETPAGEKTPSLRADVVERPRLPSEPVSPRPVRNIGLAAILGLLMGLGLAILREVLDTTLTSAEELQRVANSPVLGLIPFDVGAKEAPLLVQARTRNSPRSEAFRQLRTNLQFIDVDHPPRVIVVTSPVPNEGKSTTCANLAVMLAQAGIRTLLLEGDLRRPRVVDYLGLEGAVGLTDVLVGRADLGDVVQTWGSDGLSVLASGSIPPNPSELLGSQNMITLLGRLEGSFDVILIDAPPLLPVADGAILAAKSDGALLVVRHGVTTRPQAQAAVQALESVDARLLGTVFNMVPTRGSDGYYYSYSYADSPNGRPLLSELGARAGEPAPRSRKERLRAGS